MVQLDDAQLTSEAGTRLSREPSRAFQAFACYRDMGTKRSIRLVAAALGTRPSRAQAWSSRWRWVARARAWDDAQDELRRRASNRAVVEMAERHIRIAMGAQQKVVERLQAMDANELTPSQLIHWLEVAIRIERLSRGAPTEVVRAALNEGFGHTDLLGDDEAIELAARLVERLSLSTP